MPMTTRSALKATALIGLAAAAPAQEAFDFLRVAVADPDGEPVQGARVEVLRFEGADCWYSNLDIDEKLECEQVAALPTAKNGSIGIQVPAAIPYRVHVDVAPFAVEWHKDVYAGQEVLITLRPGAVVAGVVRDKQGRPLAAEKVELTLPGRAGTLTTACDAEGRFRFERVMPGSVYVDVEASQAASDRGQRVTVESGKTTDLEFALDPGALVRGRVLDAATGAPIAGATFAVSWTFTKPVTTDADGRYEWRGLGGPYSNNLFARAPGYCELQIPRPKADGDVVELDVRLHRGVAVTGRVLDVDGAPVAHCYVAAIGMTHDGNSQETDWCSTRTDAEGRFSIGDLRAALQPVLLVRRDQRATRVVAIPPFGDAKSLDLGDVRLRPRRVVQGTLLGADGRPAAGIDVTLSGTGVDVPEQARVVGKARTSILGGYLGRRTTRTDAAGRFFFGDLDAGSYVVTADGVEAEVEVGATSPAPLDLRQ